MSSFLALLPWHEVQKRLGLIYPDGTSARQRLVNDVAARTVFTALYINAVEGSGTQLAPKHVYPMTEEQTTLTGDTERLSSRSAS